jgi:hypothetical protein
VSAPAPAFALEEEHRGEGLAARAALIASDPFNPSRPSLRFYREAARLAFETAAAHTAQPEGWTA